MVKLYELVDEYLALLDQVDEAEGELTPELEAELDRMLEDDLPGKVERVALWVKEREAEAAAARAEAQRLAKLAQGRERAAQGVRDYTLRLMIRAGIPKVDRPLARVRVQPGSWRAEVGVDAEALPKRFRRVRVEVDRAALVAAFREGKKLPAGVQVVRGNSLVIL